MKSPLRSEKLLGTSTFQPRRSGDAHDHTLGSLRIYISSRSTAECIGQEFRERDKFAVDERKHRKLIAQPVGFCCDDLERRHHRF